MSNTNRLTIRAALGFDAASVLEQKKSLVIHHAEGVEVVRLDEGKPVTVGRSEPSDLVLNGPRLSRVHARFDMIDGEVWVEDLRSTNGTRVNGKRIDRVRLRLDDEVSLEASVHISLNVLAPPLARIHGLLSHTRFRLQLEREVLRARLFHRQVAVLLIRTPSEDPLSLGSWLPRVRELLRPVDHVGLFGPHLVEVLLPETGLGAAEDLARRIVEGHTEEEPVLMIGAASFPESGSSIGEVFAVARALAQRATTETPVQVRLSPGKGDEDNGDGPVIAGPKLRDVYQMVERIADANLPVLILGETGTGKELVARTLHDRSPRKAGPIRCINCGAIPATLLESVLFGHERGAFTGADRQSKGVFEEADGGTVLLDEIGELAPEAQVALLRVLETKAITRVGSAREVPVDVRVVAATHRNIEKMVEEGTFRRDLFYRLNTFTIEVPPLRQRRAEIRPLAHHFVTLANQNHGCHVEAIAARAMELLEAYTWPGNVRQLRNVIERSVVMTRGTVVSEDVLPKAIQAGPTPLTSSPALSPGEDLGDRDPTEELDADDIDTSPGAPPREAGPRRPTGLPDDFAAEVQRFEEALIRSALTFCGGNQTQASEVLEIPRRTLIYKMKSFDIDSEARTSATDALMLARAAEIGADSGEYKDRVACFEAHLLEKALTKTEGNQAAAARLLNMRRRTLVDKARRYDIT